MLVLSRKETESIFLPSLGVTVQVLNIQGRRAQIGIQAPTNIQVLRHECAIHETSCEDIVGRRAMVIEDGAVERALIVKCLELSGFDVISANDGQDALDYLALHPSPDIVLLDMMMPRVNGPEFVRQVRADNKLAALSILAVSGTSRDQLEHEHGAIHVDGWFEKPVAPRRLVTEIAKYLTDRIATQKARQR